MEHSSLGRGSAVREAMATQTSVVLWVLGAVLARLVVPSASTESNVLYSSESLMHGQHLRYKQYSLVMQEDCNLVAYDNGNPTWASGTWHKGINCYLQLQSDGELIIFGYNRYTRVGPSELWRSNAKSSPGSYALVLRYDGSLHVYGPARWSVPRLTGGAGAPGSTWPATTDAVLYTNDVAPIGVTIVNGVYELALQDNCNLALRNTGDDGVLWQTGTSNGLHDCFVTLEPNGELKIKYMGGETLWTSGVASDSGEYVLALGPRGQLVVYGPSLWNTPKAGVLAAGVETWGSAGNTTSTALTDE
nr:PREDICTED: mannose-specific lectin 3-like [Musa acuminata subsp. malaccensis]